MSRPASEVMGAVKRTRTVSSCAESAERGQFRGQSTSISRAKKKSQSHGSASGDPRGRNPGGSSRRKRPRVAIECGPEADDQEPRRRVSARKAAAPHSEGIALRPRENIRDNRNSGHRKTLPFRVDIERAHGKSKLEKECNDKSASRTSLRANVYAIPREDDSDGHLIYNLGDGLLASSDFPKGRYKILSDLGEGTFGKVVECWDRKEARIVAVKVVRSINKYREAAKLEIDVLLHLNRNDPDELFHCVKLHSWFDHFSHVCMVFEKLGPSLYELLRRNRFRPFSIDQVRDYAFQLLESVRFVHSLTLIHTDLKPENILLLNTKNNRSIKLIDFGSATFEAQHHSAVISTRHYRAPEVILGLGWTYPCDLWSIGCILVELYTGQALFQTHENLEHLAMMSVVLGPIPQSMIRRADRSCQKYFLKRSGGKSALNWPGGASSKASVRSVRKVKSLSDIVKSSNGDSNFLDLLQRLLAFEPDARCTSVEALSHPFFHEVPAESDQPTTTPTPSSGSSACGRTVGGIQKVPRRVIRNPQKNGSAHRNKAQIREAGENCTKALCDDTITDKLAAGEEQCDKPRASKNAGQDVYRLRSQEKHHLESRNSLVTATVPEPFHGSFRQYASLPCPATTGEYPPATLRHSGNAS